MPLRISFQHKTTSGTRDFDTEQVRIGRPAEGIQPELDLWFDNSVSRLHAVVMVKTDAAWIKDLGSRFGTLVNGRDIRGQDAWRLFPENTVVIGDTTLRITVLPGTAQPSPSPQAPPQPAPQPTPPPPPQPPVKITKMIDTGRSLFAEQSSAVPPSDQRLALLLDLPSRFAEQASHDGLFQFIMDRVMEVVPNARRGALLLLDPDRQTLLLKGYVPQEGPAVSETLARRTMTEKRGFIWQSDPEGNISRSVRELKILRGMYAPIQWLDEVFGVICVDSSNVDDVFREEDLRFLIAIAQYAGMALSGQQLHRKAERGARLLDRLMANFSPKVRAVLTEEARQGQLRPRGTKSEVTVLFCDICGFTKMAANMDAQDVAELLNDYFQPLIDVILRHEGTVDKFVGDGVLAVFGSPEPDPQQYQSAVRAAIELQTAVQTTSQKRTARGEKTVCQMRIGVHCGQVFHGFVGAMDRLEYTVIGDAVNRVHRYCSAAAPGETIISSDLYQRVFNMVKAEKATAPSKEGDLPAFRLSALRA